MFTRNINVFKECFLYAYSVVSALRKLSLFMQNITLVSSICQTRDLPNLL